MRYKTLKARYNTPKIEYIGRQKRPETPFLTQTEYNPSINQKRYAVLRGKSGKRFGGLAKKLGKK